MKLLKISPNWQAGPSRGTGMAAAFAVGLWMVVVGLAWLTLQKPAKGDWQIYWLELLACLVLALTFALHAGFRGFMLAAGRLRVAVMVSVVGLIFWGQMVRDHTLTYPFVHWSMFTNRNPNFVYYEHRVDYADGRQGPFPFEDLAVYASIHSHSRRIRREFARAKDGNGEEARKILTSLMTVYNKRNPENPITRFSVILCRIPAEGFTGLESIEKTVLLEVALDE